MSSSGPRQAAYRLGVLKGDGIGPEVVPVAVDLADLSARAAGLSVEWVELPVGLEAYGQLGDTLPQQTVEALHGCHGWVLGPVEHHRYDPRLSGMRNPSGTLRRLFDLYANERPARNLPAVPSRYEAVDLVVVRENTEGFYADRNVLEGDAEVLVTPDVVISLRVVTRRACERIAEYAFQLARRRARLRARPGRVTAVHKANVLRRGDGLFLACCRAVASRYPDVALDDVHADAAAYFLVRDPQRYDVLVTTNLFGDILSDQAAGLVGSLGVAPSLNSGDEHAMAQAVHGSAPDIAGSGVANPTAEILSVAMLFEWLGRRFDDPAATEAARRLEEAVGAALSAGVRTPDLGGSATTAEFARAVRARLAPGSML
ncbi:MAG: isocitrate/isopropylmalate dehydrogenase family protein [Armatimonadota bacterium]|nr:isocitrate/isopropylmalate dehydrogenase family protein [Armatimonadota bacterium]MDR5675827.1 isocitrate/isopropylmalate dehydrogenase family protein [Armatimonadota bacterium]MDR5689653.1 isocitrate/isopropylmalate dehydrogenase family protein [Armatimonadota bacterium]MDR7387067.1 isocitrate/isopropylmalate dehydrogenase family protein [Armatimonadota bacterium]MDR7389489.1 isocitrate/isopropylmalate dehydrogenase family protein [Armatimonadota bacterium]